MTLNTQQLFDLLNKSPAFPRHEEGDWAEEDANGVVFIRRRGGALVAMMNRADWDAFRGT